MKAAILVLILAATPAAAGLPTESHCHALRDALKQLADLNLAIKRVALSASVSGLAEATGEEAAYPLPPALSAEIDAARATANPSRFPPAADAYKAICLTPNP